MSFPLIADSLPAYNVEPASDARALSSRTSNGRDEARTSCLVKNQFVIGSVW